MKLYRITLPYACFGIEVERNGLVMYAAPIGRWMIFKTFSRIEKWVKQKKGTIELVKEEM